MFAEMFDGLRSYYAGYESRRAAAGFHAAATLSFIACIAIGSGLTLADYALHGNTSRSVAFFEHKVLLLALGALIGYAHVLLAKQTGRYHSIDRIGPNGWKPYVFAYACIAATLLVAAIAVALLE